MALSVFLALAFQPAIDALGLVDDKDGPRGPNQIDRFLSTRLLAVLVEIVDVLLVDGPDRHHHDLDLRTGSEVSNLTEFCGVVKEILKGCSRIEYPEVVFCDLERFVDALLDGD